MIARLWWKEARQVWPIWAFLVGLGLAWMNVIEFYINPEGSVGLRVGLIGQAVLITFVYMFLIGAAIFAGERENRTLALLDAMPVERWRVWVAKASFAAASTFVLGLILNLFAVSLERRAPASGDALVGFLLLCGFGWILVWSALLGNALLAAVMAAGSLTLTFIQLNRGEPLMLAGLKDDGLTIWHWLFAVALIPASALILHLGGPPRRSWLGTRRRSDADLVEKAEANIQARRSESIWPGSVSRLGWQALRETWPVWWPMALLGIGLPLAWAISAAPSDPGPWFFSLGIVGLVLGVNVFNAENRGRTQRFLAHHGARPGVVWLVKLAVGLATVAPIWLAILALTPSLWGPGPSLRAPQVWPGPTPVAYVAIPLVVQIASTFAAGVWCGMVFRRGITAGLVSLIFWLVVCLPPFFLVMGRLMWPTHLIWVPVAILAVTWAWSGDWLLDRPGIGRWARLGLYSIGVVVGLSSAYVAERVWNVPTIPPAEQARIFQFDRIAAPVPPEENAADLYREAAVGRATIPPVEALRMNSWDIPYVDWDESDPQVLDWLNSNKAYLEKLRKAAAMPVCRFRDLRKMTAFSWETGASGMFFVDLELATSSRVRFAQGDLKGAWEDIETLLRMGRQFSGPNPANIRLRGGQAERIGLSLALRWASDPRQTAESLEKAREAFRAMPRLPSLADEIRAGALVAHNTAAMPREDLARELMGNENQRKNATPGAKLAIDAMTTPWEMARLRRVQDLLAAARIQAAERQPGRLELWTELGLPTGPLYIGDGPSATAVTPDEFLELAMTTPLVALKMGGPAVIGPAPTDENRVERRALDAVLSLRLWQAQHGGRLPESLDELVKADPAVADSLIDPHARPPARFGYVRSEGQPLITLQPLRDDSLARRKEPVPTDGYMLLYSVGPDEKDDHAQTSFNPRDGGGDIIFPIKDDVPPPGDAEGGE